VHEGKLLGASVSNSFVGVWVVDLSRVEPFHSGKERGPGGGGTREGSRVVGDDGVGDAVEKAAAAAAARTRATEKASSSAAAAAPAAVENADASAAQRSAGGGGGAPFDAREIARGDERAFPRVRDRAPMAMNVEFAAAHGIGSDPLDKPPVVVAAPPAGPIPSSPPPPPPPPPFAPRVVAAATTRATPIPASVASPTRTLKPLGGGDDDDDDDDDFVVVSEPSPAERDHRHHLDPPVPSAEPPAPAARRSDGVRASRRGRFGDAGAAGAGAGAGAFDLNILRSAALEAETEFIVREASDDGAETLASAMARARAERERENNGGVGAASKTTTTAKQTPPPPFSPTPPPLSPPPPPPPPPARTPPSSRPNAAGGGPMGLDFASFVPTPTSAGAGTASTPPDESGAFSSHWFPYDRVGVVNADY